MRRFRSLDGIRGLAALSVLVFHAWGFTTAEGGLGVRGVDGLFERARWGLTAFFVLSGFLLYRPFVQAARDERRPRLSRYFTLRAARIFPAYYVVLAIVAILSTRAHAAGVVVANALMLHSFTLPTTNWIVMPTWSLCVEVQFYLALPLLARWAGHHASQRRFLVKLALVAIVCRIFAGIGSPTVLGYLIEFVPGMALAYIYERGVRPSAKLAAISGCVLLVVMGPLPDAGAYQLFFEPVIAVAVALLIAAILFAPESLPSRVLASRPLVALGTISYGVFLWHSPVLHAFAFHGGAGSLALAIGAALVCSTATAAISWRFVEKPFLDLAHRRPAPRPQIAKTRQALNTIAAPDPFAVNVDTSNQLISGDVESAPVSL